MKIDKIYNANIEKIYNNRKKEITEVSKTQSKDAIEISKVAKNLMAITNDSYVDMDKKVSEIKAKIESGSYFVTAKQLASKLSDIMKGRDV